MKVRGGNESCYPWRLNDERVTQQEKQNHSFLSAGGSHSFAYGQPAVSGTGSVKRVHGVRVENFFTQVQFTSERTVFCLLS
ncbi:hypothetical protein CEXT_652911 [Caerostris extrusa]|uniref:Uncharacterized protein n=1 Tax=Caerostris extrusa TaxID=172846 RepID=A0AAV4XTV0_CAEEX|nr:hypothetical protein CEXT_652911 [Caerostris extrusa]